MDPRRTGVAQCGAVEVSSSPIIAVSELLGARKVGIALCSRELVPQEWNEAWSELLELSLPSSTQRVDQSLLDLVPRAASPIRSAGPGLQAGEALHLEEVAIDGPAGTAFRDMMLIPLVGEVGVEAFLHVVVDISDRMNARADLERSLLSYRRELSALRDVMSVTGESLELRDILRRLLDHVLRMMKSKAGAIHLFDEDRTSLRLAAWRGIPRRVLREIGAVQVSSDPEEWVSEEGEVFDFQEIAAHLPASASYLIVPVRARGEGLGLITVLGSHRREFDESDVALLRSIGDQIGVIVENARLHRQAEQLAVVRERERLARELHDSVTQSLYSLTLLAEASQRLLRTGDTVRALEHTGRLGEIAQQALKEMRLLVYQLRPLVLRREGLVGALQQRLDAVEKRAGVDARLLVEGEVSIPASIEESLYRIAQEALNNALKHADTPAVTLHIRATDRRVRMEIRDEGRGFDPASVQDSGGMGLTSMHERAERLGGSFALQSKPGSGTTVWVDVEVPR